MAERTDTTRTPLPESYSGRCKAMDPKANEVFASFVSESQKAKDYFEMRLPIPQTVADIKKFYGMELAEFARKAVGKLATDIDESFKKILFRFDPLKGTNAGATEESHVKAQEFVDSWRPMEKGGIGMSQAEAQFRQGVERLKKAGQIPPDSDPKNWDEVDALCAEWLKKGAKK